MDLIWLIDKRNNSKKDYNAYKNSNNNINNVKKYVSFLDLPDLVDLLTCNCNDFYHFIILLYFYF